MFSYVPYMSGTIVILGNHLILFMIGIMNSFQFVNLHKVWNKIYAFESKKTKDFIKYLVRVDIHNITKEYLEQIIITVKFMEGLKLCVYPIKIPKAFYRNNAYNHNYNNGYRIQFLFIRNAEMGQIQTLSLNHDGKEREIIISMVSIQDLRQNDCYYSLIDRPIQSL